MVCEWKVCHRPPTKRIKVWDNNEWFYVCKICYDYVSVTLQKDIVKSEDVCSNAPAHMIADDAKEKLRFESPSTARPPKMTGVKRVQSRYRTTKWPV